MGLQLLGGGIAHVMRRGLRLPDMDTGRRRPVAGWLGFTAKKPEGETYSDGPASTLTER